VLAIGFLLAKVTAYLEIASTRFQRGFRKEYP